MVRINSKTVIYKVEVYTVAGQLLLDKKINDLNTNVEILSFAEGTYFFKLKFEGKKETTFKVIKS
ncbi:T9SS type A sorting domain-containing protein [Flavobacterium sp.]|uniref:T9SS type A sorting domain-containing protein n=1 Tax=Flavobacterium sp. TaxID=239 RepID=UPI003750ABB9